MGTDHFSAGWCCWSPAHSTAHSAAVLLLLWWAYSVDAVRPTYLKLFHTCWALPHWAMHYALKAWHKVWGMLCHFLLPHPHLEVQCHDWHACDDMIIPLHVLYHQLSVSSYSTFCTTHANVVTFQLVMKNHTEFC